MRDLGSPRSDLGSRRDLDLRVRPVSPAWIWHGLGLELISFFFFFFSFFFFSFFLRFLPLFLHFGLHFGFDVLFLG